jgi:hypothetical protein
MTRLASRHRGPLPPLPRQRERLRRPRAPSIDKCSQRVALSRDNFNGSPPPVSRLCHRGPGFRRAFAPPMLSPGVARPNVGSGGSSPLDAMGQTPPVDFCNLLRSASTSDGPSEPRAPRSWSPTCAAVFRATVFRRRSGLRVASLFRAKPVEMSRARGRLSRLPRESGGSSRRDRSRWELFPNPIGSDTPCRGLVATPAGVAVVVGSLVERPVDELARRARSRRARLCRAASRDPPRRGSRYAAPEVPSILGPPRERWAPPSTDCPQTVD